LYPEDHLWPEMGNNIICFDALKLQGSRGLKAVTKAKLKYQPTELDPEVTNHLIAH
jgi:hypothetical protein